MPGSTKMSSGVLIASGVGAQFREIVIESRILVGTAGMPGIFTCGNFSLLTVRGRTGEGWSGLLRLSKQEIIKM